MSQLGSISVNQAIKVGRSRRKAPNAAILEPFRLSLSRDSG